MIQNAKPLVILRVDLKTLREANGWTFKNFSIHIRHGGPLEFTNGRHEKLAELLFWSIQQKPWPQKGGKSVHFSGVAPQSILAMALYGDYDPEGCLSVGSSGAHCVP